MARAKKKRKMTAATLSRLPLSAGGALAGSLARAGAWTLARARELAYWGAARFMRAPIAISSIAAIAGFSILAGGNALFLQTGRHPAPLFFSPSRPAAVASVRPVVPATRPRPQPAAIDQETTGSLGTHPVARTIGNEDVKAVQIKLAALNLFDGTVDGLFGRRTATAIKAFEIKAGMRPTGKLTRDLIEAVLGAPGSQIAQQQVRAAARPKLQLVETRPAAALAQTTPVPLAPPRQPAPTPVVAQAVAAAPAETLAVTPAPVAIPATNPQVAQLAPSLPQPQPQPVADAPVALAQAADSAPVARAAAPVVEVASAAPAQLAAPAATAPAASDADGTVMAMNNPSVPAAREATPAPVGVAASPAQKLAAQMGTLPPAATVGAATAAIASSDPGEGAGSTDPVLITKIQRGLASLGFLGAKIDGVPGEGTAKAIRNFEVFYDYKVTGLATPQLLNLLIQHGAVI
jgi:peptidoglycan hydrolase-like protein with peptidoglycan-binding domain